MSERFSGQEYRSRLRLREAELARLDRWHRRLGHVRVAVFVVIVALLWPVLISRASSPLWLAVAVLAFVALVVTHGRVVSGLDKARLGAAFYRRGLDRMAGELGDPLDHGTAYLDRKHPYSGDLDLFDPFSLYEWLCTAQSLAGRDALAGWLSAPAAPDEIAGRQEAVIEVRDRLDLREEVAVLASVLSPEIEVAALDEWGRRPPRLAGRMVPVLAALLGIADLAVMLAWLFGPLSGRAALPVLAMSGLLALLYRRRVGATLDDLHMPAGELRFLASVLRRLEAESFEGGWLRGLQRRAGEGEGRPSERLLELSRLIEWNDSRGNLFFQPLAALLLLGTQFAFAAERWRARHGRSVAGWLRAVGELEAVGSLATFSYENPDYVFPEIVAGPARFEAEALAHPLLPRSSRVANDVEMGGEGPLRLLLVSGSNMSGKSTLLRTVGVAAVLAQAGAPVPARRLRLSPLAIGASIRWHDSLHEGVSRFYAELQRLRRIRDLAAEGPILFLLDEILHGTNSHDRRLGAAGVIRGLLASDAIGLVTTHDLALAEIADELAPAAANVHFEDHLAEEGMAFDYRLRPGVVEGGNALALMRSLGLPVEEE